MGEDGSRTQSEELGNLVAEAAQGQAVARNELVRHYWPLIRSVVRTRMARAGMQLRAREEAEDLDQEVAMKVLAELPKHGWQGKRAFIAWMKTVADNYIRDRQKYHRADRRDRGAETFDGNHPGAMAQPQSHSPESLIDRSRKVDQLLEMLEEIKPEYADAVRLHSLGLSHAEVAEALDTTAEGARKLVARGLSRLQRLREELARD